MNKKRLIIAISVTVAIVAAGVFFFKKSSKPEKPLYTTQKAVCKTLTQFVNSSGRLQAEEQITVGSLVAGRVIKIHVNDNDVVKKGQLLIELDDGIGDSEVKRLRAQLKEQVAQLEYQKNVYDRQRALYRSKQISQEAYEKQRKDLKQIRARVEQTAASLESAQKRYDNLFIKSPDNGIVIARKVDLGQMVTAQLQATELFKIAKDLTKMEARVDVDESDIGLIEQGQKTFFTVDAFPQNEFTAKVKQVRYKSNIIDNVVTYEVILDVKNNNLHLRPDMTCNVDIQIACVKDSFCIPNKAFRINVKTLRENAKILGFTVEEIKNKNERIRNEHIWVLENNTFKEVSVKTGARANGHTQAKTGIDGSSEIVTSVHKLNRENPLIKSGMFGNKKGL